MDEVNPEVRLASFVARRLLSNVLFWIAPFTFILGVRYHDIGSIAFIDLPVRIPAHRIFVNGAVKGRLAGAPYRFELIGVVVLRGKTRPVGVYSVRRSEERI